jgi:hypothetical protein
MTDNESGEPRGTSGMIFSERARIARYREQAAFFTRLAEGEPVARIRDKWTSLARARASLASTLEGG